MAKQDEADSELAVGLKAAKSKRTYFALVLKGSNDGALIVSKQKVSPVLITSAKKKSGGTAVINGFCSYEDGTYIFETAKQAPATAAQAVKIIAKRDASLIVRAEFRVGNDPELQMDSESEPAVTSTTISPAEKTPAADGAEQRFKDRFKALLPGYQKALREAPAQQTTLEPLVKAGTLAGQKGLFDQGLIILNRLEAAIQAAFASITTDTTAGDVESAKFANRFNALVPDLKRALLAGGKVADALKEQVKEAQRLAGSGDFANANLGLNGVEILIGQALAPPAPELSADVMSPDEIEVRKRMNPLNVMLPKARRLDTSGQIGDLEAKIKAAREAGDFRTALEAIGKLESLIKGVMPPKKVGEKVAFAMARLNWSRARTDALSGLANLCNTLKNTRPDDADVAAALSTTLDAFDESLYEAIKAAEQAAADAENAQGEEKQVLTKVLAEKKAGIRQVIEAYQKELAKPIIKHMDKNPFVTLNLRDSLMDPLTNLADLVKA